VAASLRAWRYARRGDGTAPWPCLHVSLDLTYRCNLRCAMCFLYGRHLDGDNPRRAERAALRELTAEEWCSLVDRLAEGGVRSLVMTGGEVMLKRGFLDVLEHAVRVGMAVSVLSNGTVWRDADIERLVTIGPALIRFSLDGDGPVHDGICRRPAFGRLVGTLERLQAAKRRHGAPRPRVAFETILQHANQRSLTGIVDVAARFSVAEVLVSNIFFVPGGNGASARSDDVADVHGQTTRAIEPELYQVDPAVAAAELLAARKLARTRGVRLTSRLQHSRDIAAIYGDPAFSFLDKCFYPWMVARIDPFGRVIPCTGSRLPLGDVRVTPFEEIWNGDAYRALRRGLAAARLFPECVKCNTLAGARWACWNWLPPAAEARP
jgi:MoaA/NifB/PqqE/SkfB family radical SAM enzyme